MIDTRSEFNLINCSFLIEYMYNPTTIEYPRVTTISDLLIRTFRVCPLYFKATNTFRQVYTFLLRFVVVDIEPFTIILG
jgi:hypothetical protein